MTTDSIEVDGVKLRYRTYGSASANVLLLHGWGASIEAFESVARAVSLSFRTVTLDLPGHGQSALPPEPWRVSDYLRCVIGFMDAVGLRQTHILAHSFGGRIAIKLAAEHPERVGRMVMTGAAGIPARQSMKQQVRKSAGRFAGKVQAFARKMPGAEPMVTRVNRALLPKLASRDYLAAGPLRETLIHVVSEDLTDWLPRIAAPVLLIWGDQDRETPLDGGETMARLIPNSELVVFRGAGHFAFVDQANKFNLLAMRHLRGEE